MHGKRQRARTDTENFVIFSLTPLGRPTEGDTVLGSVSESTVSEFQMQITH